MVDGERVKESTWRELSAAADDLRPAPRFLVAAGDRLGVTDSRFPAAGTENTDKMKRTLSLFART